jgi:hypothetical protein
MLSVNHLSTNQRERLQLAGTSKALRGIEWIRIRLRGRCRALPNKPEREMDARALGIESHREPQQFAGELSAPAERLWSDFGNSWRVPL